MITVNGNELDFDLTSPEDLRRYTEAGEALNAASALIAPPPEDLASPTGFACYITYLDQSCRAVASFIDAVFGQNTCNRLLGPKSSLEKLLDLCDAISAALEEQGRRVGVKIQKYTPNRATRRAGK